MPTADALEEIDVAALPDITAEIPCEGISYVHPNGARWKEPCLNPGEWTRFGHCSPDPVYCTPCKEEISAMAPAGWVRCSECSTKIWPQQLGWRRL